MKVRAINRGFYGGSLREPGDVFDLKSDKDRSAWMEPIADAKPAKAKPEKADPAKADDLT